VVEAKRVVFEKDVEKVKAFEVLSAAFTECNVALGRDLETFDRSLRNLQARFDNGQASLACAANGDQLTVLQHTTLEF
jgi:hypothetical protein